MARQTDGQTERRTSPKPIVSLLGTNNAPQNVCFYRVWHFIALFSCQNGITSRAITLFRHSIGVALLLWNMININGKFDNGRERDTCEECRVSSWRLGSQTPEVKEVFCSKTCIRASFKISGRHRDVQNSCLLFRRHTRSSKWLFTLMWCKLLQWVALLA